MTQTDDNSDNRQTLGAIAGLLCSFVALFLLISLVSFLFTWMYDQSLLTDPDFSNNSITASNLCGKLGHKVSHLLFSELFGFGAFTLPFFFTAVSIACFRVRKINVWRVLILSLLGCIVISLVASYIFSFVPTMSRIFEQGAGGSYGYYVNEWLISMVGGVGAGAVIFLFAALWGVLLSDKVTEGFSVFFNTLFGKQEKSAELPAAVETDANEETECVTDTTEDVVGEGVDVETEVVMPPMNGDTPPRTLNDMFKEGLVETEQPESQAKEEAEPLDETEWESEMEKESEAETESEDSGNPSFDVIQNEDPETLPDSKWKERYDPRLSLQNFQFPSTDMLQDYAEQRYVPTHAELEMNNTQIVSTLRNYKIAVSRVTAIVGPTVTLFKVVPAPGVRVSSIKRLEDDIALSLAAIGVRVVTLPGSNAIGIEVANKNPSTVSMRSILEDEKFKNTKYDLPIAIGRTISNEAKIFDLAKMPHLLVAGATGMGKSVGLNAIITSLLYKKHPSELKFVLVDPKKVELSLYSPLENHYLAKLPDSDEAILTQTDSVVYTLKSLCQLMDQRYDLLKLAKVRNIKEYNEKFLSRQLNPLKGHEFMPYIVVIIDEFADLLMTAGRDIEEPITRLAQLARAIGIHLVIATQRPTTNIITGTIKANFPARIAFRVMTSIDSKTILDQTGANHLIGRGDLLISTGSSEPERVQCAFIDTPEVNLLTQFIQKQRSFGTPYQLPDYVPENGASGTGTGHDSDGEERDELFEEAARIVVRDQVGSTSMIQRKMKLGFNRSGRIMDQLEEAGIVGPSEGSKPRQVRVSTEEALERILEGLR